MYVKIKVKDLIRIPPKKLGRPFLDILKETIREKYNRYINKRENIQFIELIDIIEIGEVKILPNDPGVFVDVVFEYLAYKPLRGEVVEGIVSKIIESQAFVNLGYFDGILHKSQIFDDIVEYVPKGSYFQGKNTKKTLKVGNKVLCRIYVIGYRIKDDKEEFKIGLTMRQLGLGIIEK